MNRPRHTFYAFVIPCCIALAALFSACKDTSTSHSSTTQQNTGLADSTTSQQSRDSAFVATADANAGSPITLPMLDALFVEEGFGQELKTKLLLTDEQIAKMKTIARESVASLAEDANSDYTGSSATAVRQADEQLKSIIGSVKLRELSELINQRYAMGDVDGVMPLTPNAVPADTRIVVNAPSYRLDVFQDGQLVKTYRIGIGYPEFPLPTGMRKAESIVFNPTWTPPDEPWVKGQYSPGTTVLAGSAQNPLGPIKIPIGLPSLIHGGKAIPRLGSFSTHGCVGMTNDQVQDFAVALSQLTGSDLTLDEVLIYAKQKKETRIVNLTRAVAIELRYETIVADSGSLRIYRDVYERGTNTLENAKRVLEVYGVSYESLSAAEKTALLSALQQMNRGPLGEPIVADIQAQGQSTNGQVTDSGAFAGVAPGKLEGAKEGKETKAVKGSKETIVPIAALQGKGYPRPVKLNSGEKPKVVKPLKKKAKTG